MAFRPTTVNEIEYLANAFQDIADRLSSVTVKMKESQLESLVLQLDSVKKHYLPPCERLAADVEMHFRDQLRCSQSGETPMWQNSVKKSAYNKALKEAKEKLDPRWVAPPKPRKKAAKKRK